MDVCCLIEKKCGMNCIKFKNGLFCFIMLGEGKFKDDIVVKNEEKFQEKLKI